MLKRICACYNSRTYGSRWVLVCPAVFKTVAGGEELPRWVRFPHTLANGNRSGSAAPVFVHFNPSVKPLVCQLPGRGAFWHCASTNYKPALKGEVDASETSRRRGCIEVALVYANPSGNPPCGVLPAPRKGEPFGYRPPECARPISRELSLICLN